MHLIRSGLSWRICQRKKVHNDDGGEVSYGETGKICAEVVMEGTGGKVPHLSNGNVATVVSVRRCSNMTSSCCTSWLHQQVKTRLTRSRLHASMLSIEDNVPVAMGISKKTVSRISPSFRHRVSGDSPLFPCSNVLLMSRAGTGDGYSMIDPTRG